MSIKVMTYVWDGFPAAGSELLAMLALADWCDDRGGSLYPSVKAVGDKARVGVKHARNIMHKFMDEHYLAVVGNHFGGKPGTTREYRLNVGKLKLLADEANAKKEAEKALKYGSKKSASDEWVDVFATPPLEVTPNPQVTPTAPLQVTPTAPLQFPDGSPAVPFTPPLQGSLSTTEPPAEPPFIPAAPTALPTAFEVLPAKAKKARKPKADDTLDTELQAACRATWVAYAGEYRARYGIDPVRNAKVNANVKDFVKRIGYTEAPGVAAFYVRNVSEAFVVRGCHALGALLQNAEAYRTQWATGQAMTTTRAQQADKTQSNFDAAQGAKALLRARREQKNAE